jgi:hypothetical protein
MHEGNEDQLTPESQTLPALVLQLELGTQDCSWDVRLSPGVTELAERAEG